MKIKDINKKIDFNIIYKMESINEVISFPLLFGIHDNCNESIKKLEKKNDELINIKKK